MPDDRPHIFDLDKQQLDELVRTWGMPRFRADQLRKWVYERSVVDPRRMTDLSKADRATIEQRLRFTTWEPVGHQLATDGTEKLLLEAADSTQTECVMIPADNPGGGRRRTACISSQVGCPVGCRFCASGLGGLERNLSAGQIVEQVFWLNRGVSGDEACDLTGEAAERGGQAPRSEPQSPSPSRITNIVFMGMGEPLTNYEAVTGAIRMLCADWGLGLSARKVTLSTVGLPAQIRRLADGLELPITLAISLHAPNDELRHQIIPWAERTSVERLIEAGRYYFEKTGREVTLEYILLGGVNDRPEHAKELAEVGRRLRANVNLIRYNEVAGLPYHRPETEDVRRFQRTLRDAGLNAHIRASRGRDIAAACGQLRHERKQETAGQSG